jgi:cobalt-zinc-cadmium efflux system outer membrane protein
MKCPRVLLIGIFCIISYAVKSSNELPADTVTLTLVDVENKFLQNNLNLLASSFNIDASRALILQAKLWDNPTIYLEQNIYNKYTGKVFDAGKTGQNIVQVQQLILLAGKRNKRVNLARINSKTSEYEFLDLMRTLKYELRTTFFETYFLTSTLQMYEEEINSLNKTLEVFDFLIKKSAISMKEVIRIKVLLFNLESERLEIFKQINVNQSTLNILLNNNLDQFIKPLVDRAAVDSINIGTFQLQALQDSALANRVDLKIHELNQKYQEGNVAYQKSLAIPDIRIGGVYDKAGSYIPNYTGLSLSIDLPFFNKNQGNIAYSKHKLSQSKTLLEQEKKNIEAEVQTSFYQAIETDRLYRSVDKNITSDFNTLIDIILKNYEKRNIGLIEFIDYYQSYKIAMLQINKLHKDRMNAFEQLNFYSGKSIIRY